MTYDASDRKEVRKAEKAAKLADRARREVIANIMSTTFGRQWMWDLLSSCHVFAQTFTADPLMTAFGEGRRAIGLALLSDVMSACPDQYLTAAREANVRSNSNNRSASTEYSGSPDDDGGVEGDTDDASDIYRDSTGDSRAHDDYPS